MWYCNGANDIFLRKVRYHFHLGEAVRSDRVSEPLRWKFVFIGKLFWPNSSKFTSSIVRKVTSQSFSFLIGFHNFSASHLCHCSQFWFANTCGAQLFILFRMFSKSSIFWQYYHHIWAWMKSFLRWLACRWDRGLSSDRRALGLSSPLAHMPFLPEHTTYHWSNYYTR